MFGTGKYLETSDVNDPPTLQTMYGIIDKDPLAAVSTPQVIANLNNVTVTSHTLPIASDPQCKTDKGWYVNLKDVVLDGERNVFDSALVAGALFTPTLVPSGDLCLGGGKSYLYCMNPFTGCACDPSQAAATQSAGIQSTPRFIAVAPAPIGRNDTTGGGQAIEVDANGRQITKLRVILLGNAEGAPVSVKGDGVALPAISGRLSWREIVEQ